MFHKLHSARSKGIQFDNSLNTIRDGLAKSDAAIAYATGQRALSSPLVLLESNAEVAVVDFEKRERVACSLVALETKTVDLPDIPDNSKQYDPQHFRNLRFVHQVEPQAEAQEAAGNGGSL